VEHSTLPLASTALAVDALLTLLLPLPLIVIANWADRPPSGKWWGAQVAAAVGAAVWLLLGLVAAGCLLLALLTIAEAPAAGRAGAGGTQGGLLAYAAVLLVTGIAAATLIAEPVRASLARVIPIDPRSAVHATALVLSVVLVGSQLASQVSADVLTQQASSGPALGPADLVIQELPFVIAAALGVGLFIRRSPAAALQRLGLVRPTGWQLLIALGAAGIFYAFGNGVDALGHLLTPGLAQKVQAANDRLFGQLLDPVGIATIALSAGICEETLFRGAMQPRLGVLWTSLVFAAVHTQYGLSLDAVAVFILAIGLGLVRRFTNTTTSTTCHVVYNTLVGVGVAGAWLGPALGVEIGLVVAGLAAVLTGRLGSLRTAP
jgi:membrane protease YdiL (CAAX protease family)